MVLMNSQPSRALIDATIVTRGILVNAKDLWGCQLVFQTEGEEVEDILVWVEHTGTSYVIQRRVQYHPPGHAGTGNTAGIKIAELVLADQVDYLLRELFYLWTRDDQVDERVRPLVQHNFQCLQLQHNFQCLQQQAQQQREEALASATVYMYDAAPGDHEEAPDEVLRYRGRVSTKAALRHIVLELPSDCSSFEIHLEVSGRIIGNAEYRVDHTIDLQTGKRVMFLVEGEYGACEGFHHFFGDLYNTEEQFNRSEELT